MRKSALYALGLVVATLVALGLVVLSSASEANGIRLHNDAYFFMKRQAAYLVAGIFVAVAMAFFDYRKWREHVSLTALFYVLVVALLGAVFLFPAINGSQRWLSCGPLRLQPSELAKLAVVISVAAWMDKAGWRVELFRRGALFPTVLIGILAALVLKEPDFGSTMVVGAAGFLVMFVAGVRLLHLLPFVGAEELGLFFSIAVIALFTAFFALSIYVARHAADRFGRFLVMGMSFIIFFQAMFNLGVVCEAMPTKGMALPFFSYGGTNLLSAFFAVGTIFSVGLHSVQDRKRQFIAKVVTGRR